MFITKFEWGGVAAIVTVSLCYAVFAETSPPNVDAQSRADAGPTPSAQTLQSGQGSKAGCAGAIYSSPFASGTTNCSAESALTQGSQTGNAQQLRAQLNQVRPCQGPQQANNLGPECVKLNAGAASLVRQLEALVEQGDAAARVELTTLVQQALQTRTASGEYLDELERAEAVLLRIAASGGIESEKKIARPAEHPADGPRFAHKSPI